MILHLLQIVAEYTRIASLSLQTVTKDLIFALEQVAVVGLLISFAYCPLTLTVHVVLVKQLGRAKRDIGPPCCRLPAQPVITKYYAVSPSPTSFVIFSIGGWVDVSMLGGAVRGVDQL